MGTYQIPQSCGEHPLNLIDPKKVHVSFVSWCIYERHYVFIDVMGHMFYINVMRSRVLYERYEIPCFVLMYGIPFLYQRYEKRYMVHYLKEMNHIFCT